MKILVAVDIEGVAGVVHPDQTRPGNAEYERARRLMTFEANAAVRGAFSGGASAVIVNDSHGPFHNLVAEEMDPRADLLLGKPRELGMMAGVEQDCRAVLLVGWHARAGAPGILAHTISSFAFARVLVNDADVGEAALYGGVAAEFGVPVALFSGDDAFIAETDPLFATSLSPQAACAAIESGAKEAIARIDALRVRPQQTPARVAVEATSVAMADLFATLPLVQRVDARTLRFTSPTMRHAVRVLNSLSAMSFMLR